MRSSDTRVLMPWFVTGSHQCCTSPARNCRRPGAQDVLACDRRLRHAQSHRILQLIAIAPGAARLVERRACPHPADERLVEEPAVQEHVHRPVGRLHLDRAERLIPEFADCLERCVQIRAAIPLYQLERPASRGFLAEEEHDLGLLARLQGQGRLQRAAGIEARAHAIFQWSRPEQRRGLGERSIPSQ